jgi:hypothetical protein
MKLSVDVMYDCQSLHGSCLPRLPGLLASMVYSASATAHIASIQDPEHDRQLNECRNIY